MPELPEVQTFINHLKKQVLNHKITKVQVLVSKILKNQTSEGFINILTNQKFSDLTRIGKYLIFHLTNDQVMVLHLRMEGKPYYQHQSEPYDANHVLLIIDFDNGYQLRYHDTRRFGTIHVYHQNNYLKSKELAKIGIDPILAPWSTTVVKKALQTSPNRMIKTVLLDQTKIAGIGNIYANEICFMSKIHPETKVKDLTEKDFINLTKAIKLILTDAITHHGTTILSFNYQHNQPGSYQSKLMVHTLKGHPCKICRTTIIKTKVSNRGTYLCPTCQQPPLTLPIK